MLYVISLHRDSSGATVDWISVHLGTTPYNGFVVNTTTFPAVFDSYPYKNRGTDQNGEDE